MKKSANSNMYEASLVETQHRFSTRLSGAAECTFLVVSSTPLAEQAQSALENSARALGYGTAACTFLVVGSTIEHDGKAAPLTGAEAFAAIEGLDPLALVVADSAAAAVCSQAYRCTIPLMDKSRLLGRDAVAFEGFATMLDSPQEKQRAWGLLKRLPRLGS